MANCPKHCNAIDIVESVFGIHEFKKTVVSGKISIPNILNPVNVTVNSCLLSVTNMFILSCSGGFISIH